MELANLVKSNLKKKKKTVESFSSVQSLSRLRLFTTPWITARHLGAITLGIPCKDLLWLAWLRLHAHSWTNWCRHAAAKSLQSCPTLCDPIDGSPPGFPVPGILLTRTLEWVVISFSNAWKWKVKSLSRVRLLATPWTAAYQAPPSMGFSRQEYWNGVPLPSLDADIGQDTSITLNPFYTFTLRPCY